MSVHKVPQDVEAEDKLLGPFTFKQMILLLIAAFLAFIMVMLARISIVLIAIPMPLFLVFLFFGIYRRKDQSVETYVAAILRFYFKPRKRIWDKDGILETVIITAPKQVAGIAVDNMNTTEVKNRLNTLGQLMDTRGWSAKNASLQDGTMAMNLTQSDRLVTPTFAMEPTEVHDSDDIMNAMASSTAQKIAQQTAAMQERARAAAMEHMRQTTAAATQPQVATNTPAAQPEPQMSDIHYQPAPSMHQNVVTPIDDQNGETSSQPVDDTVSTQPSSSVMTTFLPHVIIEISINHDRSVASIAKEADQILESGDTISLHGH